MGSVVPIHKNCCGKPGSHNAWISIQTMRNLLRRLTLCAPRPYRGPVLNSQRRAARVHWLWNNAFSFSICLTQDVRRTNAIHTLPWPAYLTSCTPSSIVEGRHWLPHKVTWPTPPETMMQLCLVIQEVWDDFPWARFTHLSPFMPRRCRVVHEAHGLSQSLLTLLYLTVRCTEQNAASPGLLLCDYAMTRAADGLLLGCLCHGWCHVNDNSLNIND